MISQALVEKAETVDVSILAPAAEAIEKLLQPAKAELGSNSWLPNNAKGGSFKIEKGVSPKQLEKALEKPSLANFERLYESFTYEAYALDEMNRIVHQSSNDNKPLIECARESEILNKSQGSQILSCGNLATKDTREGIMSVVIWFLIAGILPGSSAAKDVSLIVCNPVDNPGEEELLNKMVPAKRDAEPHVNWNGIIVLKGEFYFSDQWLELAKRAVQSKSLLFLSMSDESFDDFQPGEGEHDRKVVACAFRIIQEICNSCNVEVDSAFYYAGLCHRLWNHEGLGALPSWKHSIPLNSIKRPVTTDISKRKNSVPPGLIAPLLAMDPDTEAKSKLTFRGKYTSAGDSSSASLVNSAAVDNAVDQFVEHQFQRLDTKVSEIDDQIVLLNKLGNERFVNYNKCLTKFEVKVADFDSETGVAKFYLNITRDQIPKSFFVTIRATDNALNSVSVKEN